MVYSLEFEINQLPKTTNAQNSMHWIVKQKYVKEWHLLVKLAIHGRWPASPLERAKLTLTRFSSVEPDYDGLVSSFKPVIDGLIAWNIIVNDRISNIGKSEYLWEKVKRNQGMIRVNILEIK